MIFSIGHVYTPAAVSTHKIGIGLGCVGVGARLLRGGGAACDLPLKSVATGCSAVGDEGRLEPDLCHAGHAAFFGSSYRSRADLSSVQRWGPKHMERCSFVCEGVCARKCTRTFVFAHTRAHTPLIQASGDFYCSFRASVTTTSTCFDKASRHSGRNTGSPIFVESDYHNERR